MNQKKYKYHIKDELLVHPKKTEFEHLKKIVNKIEALDFTWEDDIELCDMLLIHLKEELTANNENESLKELKKKIIKSGIYIEYSTGLSYLKREEDGGFKGSHEIICNRLELLSPPINLSQIKDIFSGMSESVKSYLIVLFILLKGYLIVMWENGNRDNLLYSAMNRIGWLHFPDDLISIVGSIPGLPQTVDTVCTKEWWQALRDFDISFEKKLCPEWITTFHDREVPEVLADFIKLIEANKEIDCPVLPAQAFEILANRLDKLI